MRMGELSFLGELFLVLWLSSNISLQTTASWWQRRCWFLPPAAQRVPKQPSMAATSSHVWKTRSGDLVTGGHGGQTGSPGSWFRSSFRRRVVNSSFQLSKCLNNCAPWVDLWVALWVMWRISWCPGFNFNTATQSQMLHANSVTTCIVARRMW